MATHTSEANFPVVFLKNIPVIQMSQRLTVLEAVNLKQTCTQLLEQKPSPQQIILDFEQTSFIDSSGVGSLVYLFKAAQKQQAELIFYHVHPPVMAVLSMTGLDEIFTIVVPNSACEIQASQQSSAQPPQTHPSVRSWVKRWIDIVGSLVGLGITSLVIVPIAIAIKVDSPGPVFFRQTRCGWMGKRFEILKFRSMCNEAEALKNRVPNQAQGAIFKNQNDPRITRVGKFLRRTSLDELPQFWNVLKGDMSLVGTRPPTPDEVACYDVPQWQRLNVKPGMTGEWQVHGRSRIHNFEDVIKLDLRYQDNWSLLYDLKLILKTILILLGNNSGAF